MDSEEAPLICKRDAVVGADGFEVLRQPFMKLRKGTSYQALTGQSTKILSMSLTNTTDTYGVGNKGTGQVINPSSQIVINIQFNNSAREIMVGNP